jgi:hypothetical protein
MFGKVELIQSEGLDAILQSLGQKDLTVESSDRDRKKAWKAQQRERARSAFPASDALLQSLFAFVERLVEEQGCDHSLRFTKQWITDHQQLEERIVAGER